MAWVTPHYTRGQVDAAGRALADNAVSNPDRNAALDIVNNWRSAHSFPLNTIQMGLRQKARRVYASALIAQRLKRVPSTVQKLQRFPRMRLSRMQDIGGCRAVVRSVADVRRIRSQYARSRSSHTLVNERDYIAEPKESGYRGVHLVYRFASPRSPEYNGLQVEIQIRSRLQHAWATAVETVGTLLHQALKASEGEEDWLRFFQLAGSAFAIDEASPTVPNTPPQRRQLAQDLPRLMRELAVEQRLDTYRRALRTTERESRARAHYYLLDLRPQEGLLSVRGYARKCLDEATTDYLNREKQLTLFSSAEAVLVAAESLDALRRSYPNYFLDTQVFLTGLREFLERSRGARRATSR